MALANPGYLPWLLLIGVPVVVHLLTRRAVRAYALPTFQFLRRSVARQSRIHRLRHVILLALRTCLAALLVGIFLRPERTAPLAAPGSGKTAVIVLDASLSMSWSGSGVPLFEAGRTHALRVLDQLGPGSRANVILVGASPWAVLPQPGSDLGRLRAAVRAARPTEERGDAAAAIALAEEQLARADSPQAELHIISDFQRSCWADVRLDALPEATRAVFTRVDDSPRENAAVTAIHLRPAVPRAGEEITARVEVWNGSDRPRTIPVTLAAGATEPRTIAVAAAPQSTATGEFALKFEEPGRCLCAASIPPDALPADDRRFFVADLQHSMTVLLLTDEDASASPAGAYYVARALNPTPSVPGGIRVLVRRPSAVGPGDLKAADVVVLCGVATLPADRLPQIHRHVQEGGALVVLLYGLRVQAQMAALSRLAARGEGLPFLPTRQVDVRRQGKGFVALAEARFESRLLRIFRDPQSADLGRIRFRRFFLTTEPDPRAEVLLKFEDGTPAAARRPLGAGSVLLLNLSPVPADSDLARQEVFPPLLHELLKGMAARGAERREFAPGGPASVTLDQARGRVAALGPDGRPRPTTVDRASGAVVLDRVDRSGLYSVRVDGREEAVLAVNPHPDESDLRAVDPRELRSSRDRRPAYLAGAGGARLEDLTRSRPLWPWMVAAAFAVMVLEQLVAGPGRRREGRAVGSLAEGAGAGGRPGAGMGKAAGC